MIQLPHVTISQKALNKLNEYQDDIDKKTTFAEKCALAKSSFKSKNIKRNATFKAVKEGLSKMCSGTKRCVYCEDSGADEVEHIRPKDFFPDKCFVWENYLYACGICNSPKSNKFALFRYDTGDFYEVNLHPGIEPPDGEDVMINPRIENPLQYFILNLRNDVPDERCRFVIMPTLNQKDKRKAEYTLELLNLDSRDDLRKGREEAYEDYKARLERYKNAKNAENNQNKLDKMIEGIKQKQHPTVWKEMQRYYSENWLRAIDEELYDLFEECPEALGW